MIIKKRVEMEFKLAIPVCCLVLGFLVDNVASSTSPERLLEMFSSGLRNVQRETINGAVTEEEGAVPTWLRGNFIRHACGVMGHTEQRNSKLPNYIEHLFDCFEIGQKFKLEDGKATFTNKWYDTVVNDIYNLYDRDMNRSSMFVGGTFSNVNKERFDQWKANLSDTSVKVTEVPHVSWWQIGNEAVAMTETPIGVIVDPETVTQLGYVPYDDDNLGVPRGSNQHIFTNNPAHEHTEPDGTLWSTTSVVKFENNTHLKIWRVVYKVGEDKVRHVVGKFDYMDSDLRRCQGGKPYPEFEARFGYLHSFCMTENYIILPEAAYMHDPCVFADYDPYKPFFPESFHYEPTGYSRLLIMRRSDGQFVASIKTPPFFATHQLGSYEIDDLIRMDMLMYDDAEIYTRATYTDNLLSQHNSYTTNVTRITVNMTDFTARMRNLRSPDKSPETFEMSNINYAYNGRKYTYGYMARNFDRKEQNALTKINVDTGEETEYVFPEGMYVQEPQFVPTPGSSKEDDGVLLAQGVDGRKNKAFMVILNATNMNLISHVTAPDIALFGLHNRFFPTKGSVTPNPTGTHHVTTSNNHVGSSSDQFISSVSLALCALIFVVVST